MIVYRPEYTEALQLLGTAFDGVVARGYDRPIIVGGAAVEFYTSGYATSGNFDLISGAQSVVEDELLAVGFERPSGQQLQRGLVHPKLLIGVEVVSGIPFEGQSDNDKLLVVDLGGTSITIIAVEDIIADRMGQYVSPTLGDREMPEQAIILFKFADAIDKDDLDKRIRDETSGILGLSDLESEANAYRFDS